MAFRIDFDAPTATYLRRIPPHRKVIIRAALDTISKSPFVGKPLQLELAGLLSYRAGRFRIVYAVDGHDRKVHVAAIGPRESVYDELTLRLRGRGI